MKIFKWLSNNITFVITLFLLLFIPLYPKIPLMDVNHTWVYVRVEDFIIVITALIWVILLCRKKVTLKTPLTIPILFFWLIGAISTIHGVLILFPNLANVFPSVAFLSYLRRIEYLSLFFVAYSGIKDKNFLKYVIAVLTITFILVFIYGVGQRYLGFPAFLTMNEEFAKGEPIQLSRLSRVPSTFAGQYDLAAYLVFIIPIFTSLLFGIKKWFMKIFFAGMILFGFILMFMTVSRVSFFVLFIAMGIVLLFQKKRIILAVIPLAIILVITMLSFNPALLSRFGNTIKEVDIIVDAKTGQALGEAKEVPASYFKDKIIIQDYYLDKLDKTLNSSSVVEKENDLFNSSADFLINDSKLPVKFQRGIIPYYYLPEKVVMLIPSNISTGENLPQGTGYINLSLSPVTRKVGEYFFERKNNIDKEGQADVIIMNGSYLVKRAAAYDLSFTTRFQGEWPNAIQAFMRNVFLGSGYGSISLAIDNNYLRILGEVGILGIITFLSIFLITGIYIYRILPHVESVFIKSFILGYVAGVIGLMLNALLIDVFEASKIAYQLWLLTGVTLGVMTLHYQSHINIYQEFKKAITSAYAVIFCLGLIIILVYSPMINNYFVGDDFTWFRWAAEEKNILKYFTQADGFFYRPGTKLYFELMYSVFWLNQAVYHTVSIILHFIVTALVFLLAKKILKNSTFAALAGFLFVILSGFSESIFWISSTGYLFTTMLSLLSLYLFIIWEEKQKIIYILLSFFSLVFGMFFHELGIVTPFLILVYLFTKYEKNFITQFSKKFYYFFIFMPLLLYSLLRYFAHSHWFSGDYSYNPIRLPFNFIGNTLGYGLLSLFGPLTLSFNQLLRDIMKEQIFLSIAISIVLLILLFYILRRVSNKINKEDKRILIFSLSFFIVGLLPFLGLGNITSRYSYLASIGIVFLFVFITKKLYLNLLAYGKDISLGVVSVIISLFFLMHLIQIQQIQGDWRTAGKKAESLITAVYSVYESYWAKEPMDLYFVNIPIKTGEAWIYPVGLKDALWFSFRNPNLSVHNATSVQEALSEINNTRNQKVFEFTDLGIIERKKIIIK